VFKDTKEVQKKDKQPNGQKKKDKRTSNPTVKRKRTKGQTTSTKHTHTTKDRVTRTPLKTGGDLRCCGRIIGIN
jgi:hypothetical protein